MGSSEEESRRVFIMWEPITMQIGCLKGLVATVCLALIASYSQGYGQTFSATVGVGLSTAQQSPGVKLFGLAHKKADAAVSR